MHLLPKDLKFEHGGAKLASCPGRHLAWLCPWVWWILQQIINLPYPVTSHWWVSILDRIRHMKTWNSTLKSFNQLKLITSPNKYFLFLWNNISEFFELIICTPKRWPMGPLRLSLPPLAQTSSYATAQCVFRFAKDLMKFPAIVLRSFYNRLANSVIA